VTFQDHFSSLATAYALHRPGHPPELFDYLAGLAPARGLAWDCGTGNGQAAVALAERFERVVATDASAQQIALAVHRERIEYRVEPAENTTLPDRSVDLVTVAVAVHWFDLERFYREVRRVLKAGGVIAVWSYHLPSVDTAIDPLMRRYYRDIVWPYWPPGFHYVDERYETLPFPFAEIALPPITMTTPWTLERVAGFLASWSASERYRRAKGHHPLDEIWRELRIAWGPEERERVVVWPLHVRAGRV